MPCILGVLIGNALGFRLTLLVAYLYARGSHSHL